MVNFMEKAIDFLFIEKSQVHRKKHENAEYLLEKPLAIFCVLFMPSSKSSLLHASDTLKNTNKFCQSYAIEYHGLLFLLSELHT